LHAVRMETRAGVSGVRFNPPGTAPQTTSLRAADTRALRALVENDTRLAGSGCVWMSRAVRRMRTWLWPVARDSVAAAGKLQKAAHPSEHAAAQSAHSGTCHAYRE